MTSSFMNQQSYSHGVYLVLYEDLRRLFTYRFVAFGITVSAYTPLLLPLCVGLASAAAAAAVAAAAVSMLLGGFSSQILMKTSELLKSMRLVWLLLGVTRSRNADSLLYDGDE